MTDAGTLLGYFDYPGQEIPTYDPPHDGPCIVCGESLNNPMKTISLSRADVEFPRSYFYRAHKVCYESDPRKADEIAFTILEKK